MKTLSSLAKTKDGRELDPASKMYFELLERMVKQDVLDYIDGKIEPGRLNWTLEAIQNVMDSTNDELALDRLQELYEHALELSGLSKKLEEKENVKKTSNDGHL